MCYSSANGFKTILLFFSMNLIWLYWEMHDKMGFLSKISDQNNPFTCQSTEFFEESVQFYRMALRKTIFDWLPRLPPLIRLIECVIAICTGKIPYKKNKQWLTKVSKLIWIDRNRVQVLFYTLSVRNLVNDYLCRRIYWISLVNFWIIRRYFDY